MSVTEAKSELMKRIEEKSANEIAVFLKNQEEEAKAKEAKPKKADKGLPESNFVLADTMEGVRKQKDEKEAEISKVADEREEYKRIIRRNYKIIKFNLAIQHCKSHDIQRLKQELSSEGYVISKKKELGIVVRQYHIGRILLDFIIRVRQWL